MKHSHMVITTEFVLEPILDKYLATYPSGQYKSYKVVFRTENEHQEGQISYIVVFELNKEKKTDRLTFQEFLDSHCKVNNLVAVASVTNNVLPQMERRGGYIFGNAEKLKK